MLKLYIGNKNYSSWSMRPWVLLRQAGIAFEEIRVRFDSFAPGSRFRQTMDAHLPEVGALVMRLKTYALPVPADVAAYMDRVCALPGVKAWIDDALVEKDFIDFEEPFRLHP